jgi:hypothetical protein
MDRKLFVQLSYLVLIESFAPVPPAWMEGGGFQNDVRMTYCASVVVSIIRDRSVDLDVAMDFVGRCRVSFMVAGRAES